MRHELPNAVDAAVSPSVSFGRQVEFLETFIHLKEKAAVLRRHVLAIDQETSRVRAMRSASAGSINSSASSVITPLWRSLQCMAETAARCPSCRTSLQPFPRSTPVLLACPGCGFVAKRLDAITRHHRS